MNLLPFQQPEVIRKVLAGKTVAIVGLSSNSLRASNFVGRYLLHHGYDVIPVNPREDRILRPEINQFITVLRDPFELLDYC